MGFRNRKREGPAGHAEATRSRVFGLRLQRHDLPDASTSTFGQPVTNGSADLSDLDGTHSAKVRDIGQG